MEVPSAAQELLSRAFPQGLGDGEFFKLLAKKPSLSFAHLLTRAEKYANMEEAQWIKRGESNEKKRDGRDERALSKRSFHLSKRSKQMPTGCQYNQYTSINISPTQALIAAEGKNLWRWPRNAKDESLCPKSDYYCIFHKDYGHDTNEFCYLQNEIERLI